MAYIFLTISGKSGSISPRSCCIIRNDAKTLSQVCDLLELRRLSHDIKLYTNIHWKMFEGAELPCDVLTLPDTVNLHVISFCERFKQYGNIGYVSKNSKMGYVKEFLEGLVDGKWSEYDENFIRREVDLEIWSEIESEWLENLRHFAAEYVELPRVCQMALSTYMKTINNVAHKQLKNKRLLVFIEKLMNSARR